MLFIHTALSVGRILLSLDLCLIYKKNSLWNQRLVASVCILIFKLNLPLNCNLFHFLLQPYSWKPIECLFAKLQCKTRQLTLQSAFNSSFVLWIQVIVYVYNERCKTLKQKKILFFFNNCNILLKLLDYELMNRTCILSACMNMLYNFYYLLKFINIFFLFVKFTKSKTKQNL